MPTLSGQWETSISGKQLDNVRKETHVVSVMIQRLATDARIIEQKDGCPLPHQIRRPRLTERERYLKKVQAIEEKAIQTKGAEFRADVENVKYQSCNYWHPHVCENTSLRQDASVATNANFRHVETEERPSNKSKTGGAKGSVAFLRGSFQLGCVSQDSDPRKSIPRKQGKLGSNDAFKFSEELLKRVNLMSVVLARPRLRKGHKRKPCTKKRCARRVPWDLTKSVYKL